MLLQVLCGYCWYFFCVIGCCVRFAVEGWSCSYLLLVMFNAVINGRHCCSNESMIVKNVVPWMHFICSPSRLSVFLYKPAPPPKLITFINKIAIQHSAFRFNHETLRKENLQIESRTVFTGHNFCTLHLKWQQKQVIVCFGSFCCFRDRQCAKSCMLEPQHTRVCLFRKFKPSQLMQMNLLSMLFKEKHLLMSNDWMSRTQQDNKIASSKRMDWKIERHQCYTGCDWPLTSISSRVWTEDASVGSLETTVLASNPFSVFSRYKYPAVIDGIAQPAWCQ